MMAALLGRYYAATLVLALLAPLWHDVVANFGGQRGIGIHNTVVRSGVLIGLLLS